MYTDSSRLVIAIALDILVTSFESNDFLYVPYDPFNPPLYPSLVQLVILEIHSDTFNSRPLIKVLILACFPFYLPLAWFNHV